jgi:hypothetical protein
MMNQSIVPAIQETRVLLRARGVLTRYGASNEAVTETIRALCRKRIDVIGLRQYIYEILGDKANWPAREFKLWDGDRLLTLRPSQGQEKLVDVLTALENLPDRIEVETVGGGEAQVFCV